MLKQITRALAVAAIIFPLVLAADNPTVFKPIAISATDQKLIVDAYERVLDANKDMQIAILKARIACKVGEDWPINLQTMQFEPPKPIEPKSEKK